MAIRYVSHRAPAWRDRADFLVMADVSGHPSDERTDDETWEQLWTQRLDDARFRLCCVPFFAYDLALGDVVAVETRGAMEWAVRAVLEPSGHSTFRAWFGDSVLDSIHSDAGHAIIDQISALSFATEWSSANLLAIDVDAAQAQPLADALARWEDQGLLIYETGRTA